MARRSGFTLIELLVVICIIAILMGLIGVILVQISERARVAAAKSLIGTLATGCNTYRVNLLQYPPMAPYGAGAADSSKALFTKLCEPVPRPMGWNADGSAAGTQPFGPIVILSRKFLDPDEDGMNPRRIVDGWGSGLRYAWDETSKTGVTPSLWPNIAGAPGLWSPGKDKSDSTNDDIGNWEFGRVN